MSDLLTQFNKEYGYIYENVGYVDGFDDAVEWFDKHQSDDDIKPYVAQLLEERGDFISSDREAAAFAFACETLGIGVAS